MAKIHSVLIPFIKWSDEKVRTGSAEKKNYIADSGAHMKERKKLAIIGPVPPPTGGVSIHIWRLWHLLRDEFHILFIDEFKTIKPEYFNLRSLNLFRYFSILLQSDALFIHSGTNVLRIFHILAGKLLFKKVVITFHAYPQRKSHVKRLLHQFFFSLADKIILVNPDIKERIILPEKKLIIKHAFLPPVMEEEKELPENVRCWIASARQQNRRIICSNAWRLDQWLGQDLYGVDMCIEVTKRLLNKGIPVEFIFNIATIDKFAAEFEHYQQQIRGLGLQDHFHLANEQLSFVRLMENSDLVVRPTNTDGDSLSVREAIFLGKPIITSDVVERPEGSILHRNRDIDDFEKKIIETLNNIRPEQNLQDSHHDSTHSAFYKRLFRDLFN